MDEFNDDPSIEKRNAVLEPFDEQCKDTHMIIGQSAEELFAPKSEQIASKVYDKTYDVFHDGGIYVSIDGIVADKARARVLFIYDAYSDAGIFQLNCTFDASQRATCLANIRNAASGEVQNINDITDDQLAATLLVRVVQRVSTFFSNLSNRIPEHMPLGLTFDVRPIYFPSEPARLLPYVGEPHSELTLNGVLNEIGQHPSSRPPFCQAIEDEASRLMGLAVPPLPSEDKKQIAELVGEQNISCLQYIGNLLTSLFEALAGCFSSCWAKVCG